MGDIFEKIYPKNDCGLAVNGNPEMPEMAKPDSLPDIEFRDAHAPKPRISRFKANRQK